MPYSPEPVEPMLPPLERFSTETPILVELLMQRSSDSVEDVCEHLALSRSVAEFLVDYTPAPI